MGKVTISSEEYKRLIEKENKSAKKKSSKLADKSSSGQEAKVVAEIKELQQKKQDIGTKLKEVKQGKGFFKRTAINVGAAGGIMQINKAINEKKQLLKLMRQKKNLEAQRDVANLARDVSAAKQGARKFQEQERKKLSEDIFDTKNIFG